MANQDERQLATISHGVTAAALFFSAGLIGWLVPLILFLTKRNESKFVAFHTLQSLFLQGGLFIGSLVLGVLGFVTCGVTWFFVPLLILTGGIFEILAAIRSNEGKWYGIPVAGEYARKALGDPSN